MAWGQRCHPKGTHPPCSDVRWKPTLTLCSQWFQDNTFYLEFAAGTELLAVPQRSAANKRELANLP